MLVGSTAGMGYLWRRAEAQAKRSQRALPELPESERERKELTSIVNGLSPTQKKSFGKFARFLRQNPDMARLRLGEAMSVFNKRHPEDALPLDDFALAAEQGTSPAPSFNWGMFGD